jgi:putative transposase
VTKCAPEQAFAYLGLAFKRFFNGQGRYPKFKKKGVRESFYLSNDQFKVAFNRIKIPKLGWVKLTETSFRAKRDHPYAFREKSNQQPFLAL